MIFLRGCNDPSQESEVAVKNAFVHAEIASQPETWSEAAGLADSAAIARRGERIAVVGCGTSWFVAQSYAAERELAGHGVTDAFPASEFPTGREYDRVVAISRSGTTSEVLALLDAIRGRIRCSLLSAVVDSPAGELADDELVIDFADEQSVVQTRFPTTALIALRTSLGHDVGELVVEARRALEVPIDDLLDAEQVTFLGRGTSVGLASEAALKCREAAQFWSESYPAMDYRHGPIAIAQSGRLVWMLGDAPEGLAADVEATGARFIAAGLDPLAELIVAQRFAVALAERRGLDADHPRALSRSVILAV